MYRQLSMRLILIWSASGLTQHLPSLPSHTTGESHSLMLTEESTEVIIKRRSYSMSADTFGIESNAVNERVPDHPELLEVWWAGWGNYCLPIPEIVRIFSPEEEVPALVDDFVLTPLRTIRHVLQYMWAHGFPLSAAVFSVEAHVQENAQDCDGLLERFWYCLCGMISQVNVVSEPHDQPESSDVQDQQPFVSLGDKDIVCSSAAYTSSSQSHGVGPSMLDSQDFSLRAFCTVFQDTTARVNACHFSSDGKFLAYGGARAPLSIWSVETRSHIATAMHHLPGNIVDIRFQPKSYVFAAAFSDVVIHCFNTTSVREPLYGLRGHSVSVTTVDFMPGNPNVLCSGDVKGNLLLWDMGRRTRICSSEVGKGIIKQLRFQPNSHLLAVAFGKNVVVVFVQSGKIDATSKRILGGHDDTIKSIAWDPTGRFLASICQRNARIWTSTTDAWMCGYQLDSEGHVFESCVFHSTRPQLLIGSYTHVHMWDFARRSKRIFAMPTSGFISSLACSSEAGLIATTSRSGDVKLWKTE
ncbi:transcriptional corepressor LEUNIG isoform X2 [Helianthus annuus]|uniref:transcriptional corepressor LEUNIG isoform X2 n=1 Tax=Helianthus annuus TaxID=4232 RepID=UPI000B8F9361|nr:transcriptional corepressor LEUNIG isoform X2 [Helianthus annuus]